MSAKRLSSRKLRALAPLVVVALVVSVFTIRLLDLQIVSAASINEEADGRRGVTQTLWSSRGTIVDANGAVLASSVDRFDITIAPVNMKDFRRLDPETDKYEDVTIDGALGEIAAITGQDAGQMRADIDAILAADPAANFAYIATLVPLEQYQAIRDLRIPWVYPQPHPMRTYPAGSVGGSIVGFTGSDGTALAGLELKYDECLAGVNGEEMYERSADGVAIPGSVVTVTKPTQGGTLHLTIDADLQYRMQQIIAEQTIAMQAKYGTITVLEVETGNIVAAAEYPTVDPNAPGASPVADRGSRIFTWPFEPGSTIKPLTAAMLYDQGVLSPTEEILVKDEWTENGADFHDDSPHDPVMMNMNGVLTDSSNVGIALFGQRLSSEVRREYLLKFGFNERTAVEFPGEEPGIVYPAADWDSQTVYASMFGHGFTTTAAQVASSYQALANGGVRLPLRLATGCEHEDGSWTHRPGGEPVTVVSPEAAALATEGMEAMAQQGWLRDRTAVPGYRIATKTGTAQIVDPETGAYELGSYYVSLGGFAPVDDPKYVVLVTMANPVKMSSSGATADAWQQAMAFVLSSKQVAPSPQPWPEITVKK